MALSQTFNEIDSMEKELNRKENFVKNRPNASISFEYLQNIYTEFNEGEKKEIFKA